MASKIILNTTPATELRLIGIFPSLEPAGRDLRGYKNCFIRFKHGVEDGAGNFMKYGEVEFEIFEDGGRLAGDDVSLVPEANFAALTSAQVSAGRWDVVTRNLYLNFVVDTGLIDGTVA